MASRSALNLVDLGSTCLLYQLRLEEALHRLARGNYLVLNRAAPTESSIVLGTSGVVSELVNEHNAYGDRVRLIRRYTGGGTVFVDRNAIMISFIMGGLFQPTPSPRAIMNWSSDFYRDVFRRCSSSEFLLVDNDYCFEDKKFGGNAQTISGQRWVHHSSLLWDVNHAAMASYLRAPRRQPKYRQLRNHHEFLCGMKEHIDGDRDKFEQAFLQTLMERFDVVQTPAESIADVMHEEHRRATSELFLQPSSVEDGRQHAVNQCVVMTQE